MFDVRNFYILAALALLMGLPAALIWWKKGFNERTEIIITFLLLISAFSGGIAVLIVPQINIAATFDPRVSRIPGSTWLPPLVGFIVFLGPLIPLILKVVEKIGHPLDDYIQNRHSQLHDQDTKPPHPD